MIETGNSAKKDPSGTLGDAIRREYSDGHMDEVQELARQATGLTIWLETGGSLIQAAEDEQNLDGGCLLCHHHPRFAPSY